MIFFFLYGVTEKEWSKVKNFYVIWANCRKKPEDTTFFMAPWRVQNGDMSVEIGDERSPMAVDDEKSRKVKNFYVILANCLKKNWGGSAILLMAPSRVQNGDMSAESGDLSAVDDESQNYIKEFKTGI